MDDKQEQYNELKRLHKERRAAWFETLLNVTPCAECGAEGPHWLKQFVYRDDAVRDDIFTPYMLAAKGYGQARILEEMSKGEVLCAACAATVAELRKQVARLARQIKDKKREGKEWLAATFEDIQHEVRASMGLGPHFAEALRDND